MGDDQRILNFLDQAFPQAECTRHTLWIPANALRDGAAVEEINGKLRDCGEDVGEGLLYVKRMPDDTYRIIYVPIRDDP